MPSKISTYAYDSEDFLSEGSFGKLYLGTDERNGQKVCIRQIQLEFFKFPQNQVDQMVALQQKLKGIPHHIVIPLDSLQSQNHSYVISEYCEGGNLLQYLWSQGNKVSTEGRLEIIQSLLASVILLTKLECMDYIIKYENVLLCRGIWKLDICAANLPTLPFLIPKIIETDHNSLFAKIWAIAVLNYRLANGCFPLESDADDDDLSELHSVITQIPSSNITKFLDLKEKVVNSLKSLFEELSKVLAPETQEIVRGSLEILSTRKDIEALVRRRQLNSYNKGARNNPAEEKESDKDFKMDEDDISASQKVLENEDLGEVKDPYSRFLYFHLRKL